MKKSGRLTAPFIKSKVLGNRSPTTTPTIMNNFTGRFFFVTAHSTYQVTIGCMDESPQVMKVASKVSTGPNGQPLRNPVGGVLLNGFFVGISPRMVAKYRTPEGKTERPEMGSRGLKLGSQTGPPIGFFLTRKGSCEDCYAESEKFQPFDERWHPETIATLQKIGLRHPLVSIAVSYTSRWPIPRHVEDCLEHFNQVCPT